MSACATAAANRRFINVAWDRSGKMILLQPLPLKNDQLVILYVLLYSCLYFKNTRFSLCVMEIHFSKIEFCVTSFGRHVHCSAKSNLIGVKEGGQGEAYTPLQLCILVPNRLVSLVLESV